MRKMFVFVYVLFGCGVEDKPVEFKTEVKTAPQIIVPRAKKAPKEKKDSFQGSGLPQEQVRLIGTLAEGMTRIKEKRDHGTWGYCGKTLSSEEQKEKALQIAYTLIVEMVSVGVSKKISPWGILGTMYNESGFDSCALGLFPRKWAYEEGLLVRRKTGISHSLKEILTVIRSKKARKKYTKTGFDLGLCQVLSRFHPKQEESQLSLEGGVRICVLEMHYRSRLNKTPVPWRYWPGPETPWYHKKIDRWVRLMKGK